MGGDIKVGSPSRDEQVEDLRSNMYRGGFRHSDIARKVVHPLYPHRALATKAARKTFAQPQSDLDPSEDERSDHARNGAGEHNN
jgi:hypothetical protein